MKLWPALSDAARVTSRSGSWSSNFSTRRFAFVETQMYGIAAPTASAIRIPRVERPVSAAKNMTRKPQPPIR